MMLVRPRMASSHVIAQFPIEDPMHNARTSQASEIPVRTADLIVVQNQRAVIVTPDPQGRIVAMRGMVIAVWNALPVEHSHQWPSLGLPLRGAPVTSLAHPEACAIFAQPNKNLGHSDNRGARHG